MDKKLNKKIQRILTFIAIFAICFTKNSIPVFASSVNATIGNGTVAVGGQVTINVSISSDSTIWGVDANIMYDTSALEFVSGTFSGGDIGGGNGNIRIYSQTCESKNINVTLTFNAKAVGQQAVYFTAESIFYDENIDKMSLQAGTGTVTVTSPVTVSSNTNLNNLAVYAEREDGSTAQAWYWPAFSADVTNYSLNVESTVKRLAITATATDTNSTVTVTGNDLVTGTNNVVITVKAQDGSSKQYKITVEKAAGEETTSNETEQPNQTVQIGDTVYTVTNAADTMSIPEGYELTDFEYNGNSIKACKGLGTNLVLIALKNGESIEFFVYISEDNEFYKFVDVNIISNKYVVLEMPADLGETKLPEKYKLNSINIGNNTVEAYGLEDSKVYIVYAMNSSGEKGFYYYDSENDTMMQYFALSYEDGAVIPADVEIENKNSEINSLKFQNRIILIISITVGLLLVGVIITLLANKKEKLEDAEDDDYSDEYDENDAEENDADEENEYEEAEEAEEVYEAVNEASNEDKEIVNNTDEIVEGTDDNSIHAPNVQPKVEENPTIDSQNEQTMQEPIIEEIAIEEAVEKTAKEVGEEASKVEETAEEVAKEAVEETVEEVAEEAVEETVEEAVKEEAKETSKETAINKPEAKPNLDDTIELSKILEDVSKSLDEEELDKVLDKLLDDIDI